MLEYIVLGAALAILVFILNSFRPVRTAKVADGLYAINCAFVNLYAYRNDGGIALFDAGLNSGMVRRGMKKLGLPPDEVRRIFLTHTDYDHTGGLSAFPNAEVFISATEEQMINGRTARRGFMRNSLSHPYKTLQDGETVKHGGVSVKLILTPGHTPGSAAYLMNEGILVTGDLLRLTRSGDIKPFFRMMNKDHRQNTHTVTAMRGVFKGSKYILTGHTGVHKKT